jgi:PKD repeat protein
MRKKIIILSILAFMISIYLFKVNLRAETPPSEIKIDIPDPEFEKNEGYDIVSIPDGDMFQNRWKPAIPYYTKVINYPKSYKIQDVIIKERDGLKEFKDLNIRLVNLLSPSIPDDSKPPDETIGWFPKEDFDWVTNEKGDGSTDLIIHLYPFFYNYETREAKFYKNYELKIDYVYSPVVINYINLDKIAFSPDEKVNISVEIENGGKDPKDLILASQIIRDNHELIDTLPLKEMNGFKGVGNIDIVWENSKKATGRFYFILEIKDYDGTILDKTLADFQVGVSLVEIKKFDVNKEKFNPFDNLEFLVEIQNKSYKKEDGRIVIRIFDKEKLLKEFSEEFSDLDLEKTYQCKATWNTSDTKKGEKYKAIAFAYYSSKATEILTKDLSTNTPPKADFSYTPSSPLINETINFDAALSKDSDGEIASYLWDFGDGYTSYESKASHKYEKVGRYSIKLTVTDNVDDLNSITKIIEVKEKVIVQKIIIRLYIDKTTYYVNDEMREMDAAPIIKESRTLLPIRYVAEALGAVVQWDAVERKVTITFKETTIELWIDKNNAKVNGEYKLIDSTNPKVVPVIIPTGRTMLPIRFIAENLGCRVDWDPALKEVKITYPAE